MLSAHIYVLFAIGSHVLPALTARLHKALSRLKDLPLRWITRTSSLLHRLDTALVL